MTAGPAALSGVPGTTGPAGAQRTGGVLLVGGSSEIGVAIAAAMTVQHAGPVVLAGRTSAGLTAAATRLRAAGGTVHCLEYDAAWPPGRTADLIRQAQDLVPVLDLVVIAVGLLSAPLPDTPPPDPGTPAGRVREAGLEELIQVNLTGPALVANEAAAMLAAHGGGQLVVVTSAAAARPRGQILGYSVAKQGLDSFVRGLDQRTRPYGVRCYVVRPGQVRTRMTAGLPDVPFTTGPGRVAQRVQRALNHRSTAGRSGVVWSPAMVRPVTALLRLAPNWALPAGLR